LDVTREESLAKCVAQILGEAGSIDILVNNAGSGYYGALEDMSMLLQIAHTLFCPGMQ